MANIVIDVEETLNPLSTSKRSMKQDMKKSLVKVQADPNADTQALLTNMEPIKEDMNDQNKSQTQISSNEEKSKQRVASHIDQSSNEQTQNVSF